MKHATVAAVVVALCAWAVWAAEPTSLPVVDAAIASGPAPAPAAAPVASLPAELVGKSAEVFLRGGGKLSADVIKRDGRSIVVDLGFTVVQVPIAEISRVVLAEAASAPAVTSAAPRSEDAADTWRLYRTAKLERTTIERAAQRYGEGVVMVTSPGGLGSGFVVTPDGYVVTNYHVISNETKIRVTVFKRTDQGFEQKNYKKVRIIAINPFVDLALLKIDDMEGTLKYVYLGKSEDVEAGQDCFAIGNPLGLTRSVSQGIISTKNRNFEGQLYIQTTADIAPGNSGGPLFNLQGEVIGVTSMGYIYFSGLNFAIPVDVVKRFIENRDAFAYDEDNPNSGYRYLQPSERANRQPPPPGRLPDIDDSAAG
jgi:serine protease Do